MEELTPLQQAAAACRQQAGGTAHQQGWRPARRPWARAGCASCSSSWHLARAAAAAVALWRLAAAELRLVAVPRQPGKITGLPKQALRSPLYL